MAQPHLIVHIGHGKTGSTSIQRTLERSRDPLAENGTAYLGRMLECAEVANPRPWQNEDGAELLLHRMSDDAVADEVTEVLSEALQTLGDAGMVRAVWSNEALFARRRGVGRALSRLVEAGTEVSVVLYLRRHDRWAKSAYAQWGIRHKSYPGPVLSFDDWIKANPVRFAHMLEFWDNTHGSRLMLRNFDRTADVVADFLEITGIGGAEPVRVHETPSSRDLLSWAVYNSREAGEVTPERYARLLNAAARPGAVPPDAPPPKDLFPSTASLAAVLEDARDDLASVNAVFERLGVDGFSGDDPVSGMKPPGDWDVLQHLMSTILSCQEQILQLRRRVSELERDAGL